MTGESRSLMNAFKTWWKCLSVNSMEIMNENKSVSGYHLGVLAKNPAFVKTVTQDINTLIGLYEQGKIKIVIDSTYSFSKIGEAMKRMHQRLNVGKIILKPDSEMPVTLAAESKVEVVVPETASTEQVKLISTEPLAVDSSSLPVVTDTLTSCNSTASAEVKSPEVATIEIKHASA